MSIPPPPPIPARIPTTKPAVNRPGIDAKLKEEIVKGVKLKPIPKKKK
jgi:hypothetical protein